MLAGTSVATGYHVPVLVERSRRLRSEARPRYAQFEDQRINFELVQFLTFTMTHCSFAFTLALCSLISALNVNGQDADFRNGWEAGYKQGWCYGFGGECMEPIVPICPIPRVNESGYNAGYNNGFLSGQAARGGNGGGNSSSGQVRYGNYDTGTVPTVQVHPYIPAYPTGARHPVGPDSLRAERKALKKTHRHETRSWRESQRRNIRKPQPGDTESMQKSLDSERLELERILRAAEERQKEAERDSLGTPNQVK